MGNKGFLDPNNLLNIIRQTAIIAVMSVTMTFVLSTGEIDLSVGAVAGLASVATAMGIDQFGHARRHPLRPRHRRHRRRRQRLADHGESASRPS